MADPQERYDIFMNNFTERTWMAVPMQEELKKIMATYVKYPPRKLQSYGYTGPITLSNYERFQWVRDQLAKEGVNLTLPTGNWRNGRAPVAEAPADHCDGSESAWSRRIRYAAVPGAAGLVSAPPTNT